MTIYTYSMTIYTLSSSSYASWNCTKLEVPVKDLKIRTSLLTSSIAIAVVIWKEKWKKIQLWKKELILTYPGTYMLKK
jgi:hypothetical protein